MKSATYILLIFLTTAAWTITRAQTSGLSGNNESPVSQVVVTFTLPSPVGDYSMFQNEENKERFYLKFPTTNVPSFRVAPAGSLKVMVDNEKSDQDSIVFWVPVVSGTSPRIDRSQSTLTLTFTPPTNSAAAAIGETTGGSVTKNGGQPAPSITSLSDETDAAPATSAGSSLPDSKGGKDEKAPLPFANVDLSVPESPAFTVLGLTPETVVRPNSPRQFATALLSGVDRNGNFQTGTALDTVPYLLLAGKNLTLGEYRRKYRLQLASRTQFSFATTKGASEEDKSVRLSLGLRMTLWDRGDPRFDETLIQCFRDANKKFFEAVGPNVVGPDDLPPNASEERIERAKKAFAAYEQRQDQANTVRLQASEECRAQSRKDNWNRSSWIIAYAPSWISTTGETKNFKWNGGGIWTSFAYGFEGFPALQEHSQIIFHARYRSNEQVPDPANKGSFIGQDSLFFGSRLRVGNENATGSFEGVFVRSRPEGKAYDNSARYSLGLERRVAENMWFGLSFGGETGRADGKNKGFVLTSFRWGFSEKPSLAPKP